MSKPDSFLKSAKQYRDSRTIPKKPLETYRMWEFKIRIKFSQPSKDPKVPTRSFRVNKVSCLTKGTRPEKIIELIQSTFLSIGSLFHYYHVLLSILNPSSALCKNMDFLWQNNYPHFLQFGFTICPTIRTLFFIYGLESEMEIRIRNLNWNSEQCTHEKKEKGAWGSLNTLHVPTSQHSEIKSERKNVNKWKTRKLCLLSPAFNWSKTQSSQRLQD